MSAGRELDVERAIGITTTVPVELVFAAGLVPVDLNNVFITSGHALQLVESAERSGFPKNSCCWAKGIFGTAREMGLKRLVAVVEGDCSNTHALAEMLRADGLQIVPFSFPYDRDPALLELHMRRFASALGSSLEGGESWKAKLDTLRRLAHRIDELNWRAGVTTPLESHLWSISCSDFLGDTERYRAEATKCIEGASHRSARRPWTRLGLLGIPPICEGLLDMLERKGADVVFNEVPRQFSMPAGGDTLLEQYLRYTYPYDVFGRIEDIAEQVAHRRIDGVIHYVQSFCFRQVQDVLIRRALNVPVLTLECDRPGPLDSRTVTRIEAFLEILSARRPPRAPRRPSPSQDSAGERN